MHNFAYRQYKSQSSFPHTSDINLARALNTINHAIHHQLQIVALYDIDVCLWIGHVAIA